MKIFHAKPVTAIYAILANAIPLYGVFFLDWSIFIIFYLYWFENLVIGIFVLAQIIAYGLKRIIIDAPPDLPRQNPFSLLGIIFLCGFFCVHYGLFTFGHGTFVFSFFTDEYENAELPPLEAFIAPFFEENLIYAAIGIILAATANAIRQFSQKHAHVKEPEEIMAAPYGRVTVLHIGLLIGGGCAEIFGSPIWALGLLVLLKSAYDLLVFEIEFDGKNKDAQE